MTDDARGWRHGKSARRLGIAATLLIVIALGIVTVLVLQPPRVPAAGTAFGGPAPTITFPNRSTPSTSFAPAEKVALFVGDSYTAGKGAGSQDQAESCLTAQAMGWKCDVDAEGGTGFVADGHANRSYFRPAIDRLAADQVRYHPDIVIVDFGRNDAQSPPAQVTAAAERYLLAVRHDWPKSRIVLIVPYFMSGNDSRTYRALSALYRTKNLGEYVVDPTAEGWISSSKTAALTIADHVHPNEAGHQYIATHVVADLKKLGLS